MSRDAITIRPAQPADRAEIVGLLARSLGRDATDPRYDTLFAWKHDQSPFGPSPMWVAVEGGRIVGFRAFMRWQFERDGRTVPAARAVDTATHPDAMGRGVFTRLTLHGLEGLRELGVAFVFNTPNDQSRPGYLKMGWRVVGRPAVSVRPRSAASLLRVARSRVPAERWSEPCAAGRAASEVVQETAVLDELLASGPRSPTPGTLATARSAEHLAWRYGTGLLGYRAVTAAEGLEGGVAFVRVRRRGAAREVVVADVLTPGREPSLVRALLHRVRAEVAGDYLIRLGGSPLPFDGFVRLPRQGPVLTWRAVTDPVMPALRSWALTLGDIEFL